MTTVNSQLTTILNSFVTRTRLVYNTADSCFYSVGSVKNLSKDYITQAQGVRQKVSEFIQQNSGKLDFNISDSFRKELEDRIKRIHSKTTGILAFFHFLFNPSSRQQLIKTKQGLEELNDSIKEALQEAKVMGDNEEISEQDGKTQNGKPSPAKPTAPTAQKPTTPNNPSKNGTSRLSTPGGAPTNTITAPPALFAPPPPPPPPPMNAPKPQAITLPGEPKPLLFDPISFKDVSEEVTKKQLSSLEKYFAKLNDFLKPFEDTTHEIAQLRSEIDEKKKAIADLEGPLQDYQKKLKLLKEGQQEDQIVFLFFKDQGQYYQVPFYPDHIHQNIQSLVNPDKIRAPIVPPESSLPIIPGTPVIPTTPLITTTPSIQKSPLPPPPKTPLSTSTDEDEEDFDGIPSSNPNDYAVHNTQYLHKEIAKKFSLTSSPLTPNPKAMVHSNSIGENQFEQALKISEAIKAHETLIQENQEQKDKLQAEIKELETKIKENLEKKILQNDPRKFSELEKIFQTKIIIRNKCKTGIEKRKTSLTTKKTTTTTSTTDSSVQSKKKKPKAEDITNKIPAYAYFTALPTNFRLKLMTSIKHNLNPSLDNFSQTIWSVLKAELPKDKEVSAINSSTSKITSKAMGSYVSAAV